MIDHRGGQGRGDVLWSTPAQWTLPRARAFACRREVSFSVNLRSEDQVQTRVPLSASEMTRRTDTLMESGEPRIEECRPQLEIIGPLSVVHASPQEVIHHTPWTIIEVRTR